MIRLVVGLVGLAILGAIFASVYYDPNNLELKQSHPAFNLEPGEVVQTTLPPSVAGTDIVVEIHSTGAPFDLYVMDNDWSILLPQDGRLSLDRPFSYDAEASRIGVNGTYKFTILSDGVTEHLLVFDHSDSYYDNDTLPPSTEEGGTVGIEAKIRYVAQERRSLVLGYIAAVPSVLLVGITVWRRWKRRHPEPPA